MGGPPTKLLHRVRYHIRVKGYSIRTEQSYVSWIRRFILFHNYILILINYPIKMISSFSGPCMPLRGLA